MNQVHKGTALCGKSFTESQGYRRWSGPTALNKKVTSFPPHALGLHAGCENVSLGLGHFSMPALVKEC